MIAAWAKWKNFAVEKMREKLMPTKKIVDAENRIFASSCSIVLPYRPAATVAFEPTPYRTHSSQGAS